MGKNKKNKQQQPQNHEKATNKIIKQHDLFLRMNFLYQAAHLYTGTNPETHKLGIFYSSIMKRVASRSVIRMAPEVKQNICPHCSMLLLPGITQTVEHVESKDSHFLKSCDYCGCVRRMDTFEKTSLPWPQRQRLNAKQRRQRREAAQQQQIQQQQSAFATGSS